LKLVPESISKSLPRPIQSLGFFTSVSSNGARNAIVWAVGRPVDKNPAHVTLYAYGPQAAAQGNNAWLFSAVAGTWPNGKNDSNVGNANIVPVVANGRVYVASYKSLAIFGLPPASGATSAALHIAPPAPSAPLAVPANERKISGTIMAVAGNNITLATRTGKPVRVDAAGAVRRYLSVVLLVGAQVTVSGNYDGTGVLVATRVLHAKPSPGGWPEDR
jgi:hypothetical protein